jgi:hypothetical protein
MSDIERREIAETLSEVVRQRATADRALEPRHRLSVMANGRSNDRIMRIVIAVITLAFVVVGPASAESAKSFAPGHHAKGIHGSSFYAPGHEKKRLYMQSARRVAPGHLKY